MTKIARTLLVTSILAVAGISAPALAGSKQGLTVRIDQTAHIARGNLGAARNSADANQYIGCYITTNGQGFSLGVCVAVDAQSTSASCIFVNNPGLQAAVQALNGDSLLLFGWDTAGTCTTLQVENFSTYEPKK